MDCILNDIHGAETHRHQAETSTTDFVIREARSVILEHHDTALQVTASTPNASAPTHGTPEPVTDLTGVLNLLRASPELDELIKSLQAVNNAEPGSPLYLRVPGPKQAQVIKQLVDKTVIDFWHALSSANRQLLGSTLRSVAAINALLAAIQHLLQQGHITETSNGRAASISILVSVLDCVLPAQSDRVVKQIWIDLQCLAGQKAKHDLAWREAVTLFGSGKIVSVSAESLQSLAQAGERVGFGLVSGSRYAQWIAEQIACMVDAKARGGDLSPIQAAAQLLSKPMSLGYSNEILRSLLTGLQRQHGSLSSLPILVRQMIPTSKRRLLETLLAWLSLCFPGPDLPPSSRNQGDFEHISAVGGLLVALFDADEGVRRDIVELIQDARSSSGFSLSVRRAIVAALAAASPSDLSTVLTRTMAVFGDQLFIKHSPLLQQSSHAQTILLCAGRTSRYDRKRVLLAARSAQHMQGVSNRLACSSDRARWLGMVVGTAISRLVDEGVTKMDFGTADMESEEAAAYFELINASDTVGKADDLVDLLPGVNTRSLLQRHSQRQQAMPKIDGKQTFGPLRPPPAASTQPTEPKVMELPDGPDEDDDLKPYAKPDSDPEDSDEDATLVNRKKARPPVYVRTLMSMLRDHDNADKFQLAVKHAASLIRRKTGHGREVSDHAEDLARILTNLEDHFDTENFDQLRLQALIALILADVNSVAPWLSRQALAGDYSIAQRLVMLTSLGIAGRELAGYQKSDWLSSFTPATDFPSKRLPSHLHALYDQSSHTLGVLDSAERVVEQELVQPMALAAADKTTSHLDAVKVRNFSSRMSVERTRRRPQANALAKVLYPAFFYPLLASFQTSTALYRSSSLYATVPALLTTFIKTLAILIHAGGPGTLELSQITSEFWQLLLHLRVQAIESISVTESLLFGLLTLLDINTDHSSIATEHARELMETKEWVEVVFDRTGGGTLIDEGQGEESRLRTLCAAVLTKTNDVIEAYQRVLMGRLTDL